MRPASRSTPITTGPRSALAAASERMVRSDLITMSGFASGCKDAPVGGVPASEMPHERDLSLVK